MPRGGKRIGAGKPVGTKNRETLTKEAIAAGVRQRIMQNADKLLTAQFTKAFGSVQIFQVIKKGEKYEHEIVTDATVIKEVLDEGQGMNCTTDRGFFIVTEIPPETKAIDSMLDRALGKAAQSIEITTDPRIDDLKSRIQARATEKGIPYEQELAYWNENFSQNVAPEIKEKLISEIVQ